MGPPLATPEQNDTRRACQVPHGTRRGRSTLRPSRTRAADLVPALTRRVGWRHETARARRHRVPVPRGGGGGGRARPRRHLRLPRGVRDGARGRDPRRAGTAPTGRRPPTLAATAYDAVVDVPATRAGCGDAVAAVPGRALGLRLDHQRLRRRLHARRHARHPAPARAGRTRTRTRVRPRGLRRDEGRLRAAVRDGAALVDGDPARA